MVRGALVTLERVISLDGRNYLAEGSLQGFT